MTLTDNWKEDDKVGIGTKVVTVNDIEKMNKIMKTRNKKYIFINWDFAT